MMRKYVMGIDTGATKSHLALFDTEGSLVDFCRWGPLNYEILPGLFVQLEEELGQFIGQALTSNGIAIDQISYAVFGMAGVDTMGQHRTISDIFKRIGFHRFTLCNDAFLGIPAGSPTGAGICAINGTGCTLAGMNQTGKMFQIGGVGPVSGDMGGGGTMGERVVASVYAELFRKGVPTCMTPLLFEDLGISSKYDFVERIYKKMDDGTFDVDSYCKLLFAAARQNDRVAAEILQSVAAHYADGISGMMEEMAFPKEDDLYVVLAGSVFVKGEHPLLVESLKKKVSRDNPDYHITYTLLDVPTVAGAVIWALNLLGGAGRDYGSVRAQLSGF